MRFLNNNTIWMGPTACIIYYHLQVLPPCHKDGDQWKIWSGQYVVGVWPVKVVGMWSVCGWRGWYVVSMWLTWSVCSLYVVDMWSVCGWYVVDMWLACGQYVVDMWSVCGWYVVDMWLVCHCGWYVGDMWLVCGRYVASQGGLYVVDREGDVDGKSSCMVGMWSVTSDVWSVLYMWLVNQIVCVSLPEKVPPLHVAVLFAAVGLFPFGVDWFPADCREISNILTNRSHNSSKWTACWGSKKHSNYDETNLGSLQFFFQPGFQIELVLQGSLMINLSLI